MSHSVPSEALVVVADGHNARFYRNHGTGDAIVLREEKRLEPKDLDDEGPSGSRPEEQTARQTDEATFAKQLGRALFMMRENRSYEALVLIADPQTLGQLRDVLHKTVSESLVLSIPKELINHSVEEISQALRRF